MAIVQSTNLLCPLLSKYHFGISQFSISSAEIKESLMESMNLVVQCSFKIRNRLIDTHTLIDYIAMWTAAVDKDFVCHHQVEEKELGEWRELEVIDGRSIKLDTIMTMAKLNSGIQLH